jgi:ElaB/YqjD/DUF883 family membrane-anchored ribosome-binding protein
VEQAELEEKVHELSKNVAVQQATLSGAQATQAAAQAGMTSTFAATQTGTWAVMATGGISLVVGIFLGVLISRRP